MAKNVPICNECEYRVCDGADGFDRVQWSCSHEDAQGYTKRFNRSLYYDNTLVVGYSRLDLHTGSDSIMYTTKTSPMWCPLRGCSKR